MTVAPPTGLVRQRIVSPRGRVRPQAGAPWPPAVTPRPARVPEPPATGEGTALRPWPLVALLALYPLWWVLGLGVLIFPLLAVPMAWMLWVNRYAGRRMRVPPGFGVWLLFLVTVLVSTVALGQDPPGTVPDPLGDRLVAVGYRVIEYAALTVIMLFAGNLTERQLPQRRLVRLLAWLFGVTVAGGLLGIVAGHFQFESPLEMLLPGSVRNQTFVQTLVHPAAAQLMTVLGHPSPRPAAPWGYTNTWGNDFCLLVVWFVAAAYGYRSRHRLLATLLLAVSVVPVVYSLNRGLWVGLGVAVVYLMLRLATRGRMWIVGVMCVAGAGLLVALMVTPLGGIVSERLNHGKSNGVRLYLTEQAVSGLSGSPVIGFGSTRTTQGGRQSIAVGQTADCPRCGNFTVGGNGQLWQVLYAHGVVGTVTYFGFFLFGLWRFRRDRTPIGLAGSAALVGSFAAALWYDALVTPLAFTLLGYALLWRNAILSADAVIVGPCTRVSAGRQISPSPTTGSPSRQG